MVGVGGRGEERLYLPILLGGMGLCVLLFAGVNFAVDPLQILRRASYPALYIENQRHQNAGLIRTHDYAAIVVGTSHVENFSPRALERLTGQATVKLAIEGSNAAEQAQMVRAAIATGRVERVIWGLDHLAFRDSTRAPWGERRLPRHLYEPSPTTLSRYLLSLDTLALSRDALLGGGHRELETLNRWGESSQFGSERVDTSWRRIRRNVARERAKPGNDFSPTAERTRKKVDYFVGELVRAHPEVEFDLFFAPYSIVAYAVDHLVSAHEFAERLDFKRNVVDLLGRAPNVRIYDFQVDRRITHDLRRYKDVHHFDVGVSDGIVRVIAQGQGFVEPDDYERVLALHERQVDDFLNTACRTPALIVYCVADPQPPR